MDAGQREQPRAPGTPGPGTPGNVTPGAGGPGPGGPPAGPVPGVILDPGADLRVSSDLRADQAAGPVVRTPARLAADGRPVWLTVVVEDLDGVTRKRIRTSSQSLLAASRLPDVPTLLPWLEAGEGADGRPFLVCGRVGPSLVTLSPATPDRPALALAVLRDIAAALAGVHAAGLVHGGVGATAVEHRQGTSSLALAPPLPIPVAELVTAVGGGTGMEPVEVLAGRSWTSAGDVYALCALIAAVATGRPMLPATAAAQAARLHRLTGEEERPDLRDVLPPAAAAAVLDGLRRDPSTRPTARALLRAAGGDDLAPADLEVETIPPRRGGGAVAGPAPAADLGETVGRPLGSRYLLDEVIGRGASGRVWRGRRRGDGSAVAVKVLRSDLAEDPDVVLRFLRERNTLTGLSHPHLVRVLDLVAEGDTLAIVMELVAGRDLTAAGPLPAATACRLLAQTAEALDVVHAAGVVHRDLKPANILLAERDGRPWAMLTDFGLARAVDSAALTHLSQLVGTPAYLAPELVAGREPTPAADVYALGITAYELLAGHRPFGGDSAAALMRAHLDTAPPRPAGLPDDTWAVLAACLAKDPTARPDARDVASGFTALAEGRVAPGLAPGGVPPIVAPSNSAIGDPGPGHAGPGGTPFPDAAPKPWTASSWGAGSQIAPVPVRVEPGPVDPSPEPGVGSATGAGPVEPPADETALSLRPPAPERPEPPAPPRRRRWPWVAAAAAVVVLGVGTGVVLAVGGDDAGGGGSPTGGTGQGALTSFPITTRVGTSGSGLPVVYWDTKGLTGTDFFLLTSGSGTTIGTRIDPGEDRMVVTDPSPDGCYLVLAVGADSPPPTDTPTPDCLPATGDPSSSRDPSTGASP